MFILDMKIYLEYFGVIKMRVKDEIFHLKYSDVNTMRDKVPEFLLPSFQLPFKIQ